MMNPYACRVVITFAVLAATSVGCSSSSTPTSPSATASVPQQNQMQLTGFVMDSAFRSLAGATVEVVDGPQAGLSTTADASGRFSLSGDFSSSTTFRASAGGYMTTTQPWTCATGASCWPGSARPYLAFYLAPLAPPVNIAGNYTLTFVTDPVCTDVPAALRTRTYLATILPGAGKNAPAGSSFVLKVSGGSFAINLDSFRIGVAGDYVSYFLDGGHDAPVVEQLADSYLAFSGSASGPAPTASVPSISMAFDGWIEYCATGLPMRLYYACPAVAVHCESTNNQLILAHR
jgi:hypothetical protein